MKLHPLAVRSLAAIAIAATLAAPATAQEQPRPRLISPEISAERQITVRLRAAEAKSVLFSSSDVPSIGRGKEMQKGEGNVWSVTLDPVSPGAYRYQFIVDGVAVIDPRNPATSESNMNTWSLVTTPGSEKFDTKDVPHGAISEVTYHSKSLQRFRRMHVYTPPGYESGEGKLPVLYLLHGATDSDDSWSSVGRAGFILDNLIAAGKAKPMLVVMPHGHTGPFTFGGGGPGNNFETQMKEFVKDFEEDIRPHVEKRYRVRTERKDRAIAGLSMGGAQSLLIAIPHLDQYSAVGVFSSGIFGIEQNSTWEKDNTAALDNATWKEGLDLVWFATGKEDFLINTSRKTVDTLKNHGFKVTWNETSGGHTWLNWRDYLYDFVPLLFQTPKQ